MTPEAHTTEELKTLMRTIVPVGAKVTYGYLAAQNYGGEDPAVIEHEIIADGEDFDDFIEDVLINDWLFFIVGEEKYLTHGHDVCRIWDRWGDYFDLGYRLNFTAFQLYIDYDYWNEKFK